MDYPVSHRQQTAPIPWRALALAAAAVAAVELLLLIIVGSALLVNPSERGAKGTRTKAAIDAPPRAQAEKREQGTKRKASTTTTNARPAGLAPVAELPRKRVAVMVLNGNGVTGAAAAAARRVSRRGYRIGTVGNAPSSDYTRSVVMYRRGFEGEGVRLARDLDVTIVGPLDGLRASDLRGAHTVFVIGS